MSKTARQKATKKAMIYRGLAIFFLLLQLSAYAGEIFNNESAYLQNNYVIYFSAVSLFLYVSLVFFYMSYKAGKTARTIMSEEDLEDIGQNG